MSGDSRGIQDAPDVCMCSDLNPVRTGLESMRQQRHPYMPRRPNGPKDHSFPLFMYAKGYTNHATAEASRCPATAEASKMPQMCACAQIFTRAGPGENPCDSGGIHICTKCQMGRKTIVSPCLCMQKAIQIMRQQRHPDVRRQQRHPRCPRCVHVLRS